jgi:hypothetical protein
MATETWDGRSVVAHATPVVDEYDLDNGDFFFVVGASVDGTVREFATERHRQTVQRHGCDPSPEITETELDGAAALHLDMLCSGNHVQRVYAVKDGRGLVLALGANATRKDENRSTFRPARLHGAVGVATPRQRRRSGQGKHRDARSPSGRERSFDWIEELLAPIPVAA